ncbi:unnamed protein product [Linum tenue]|uniref:Calmodulin-binding protein n=1 Tax=Linum tenue TaxID=586396 RepID=A0AAV0RI93_9ROSI|nr:unnamed protein product [Linum tenue]
MEVVKPVPAPPSPEFNFDSSCSSPYITAPSSPQRFGTTFFFSAPTSPSAAAAASFFLDDSMAAAAADSSSAVPFNWEEKPGTPKRNSSTRAKSAEFFDDDYDFEFDFSGQLGRSSLSAADELFDGGKIRPLKPPPGYDSGAGSSVASPRSPRSRAAEKKRDFDPFRAAIEENRKRDAEEERGRGRRGAIGGYSGQNSDSFFDSVSGRRGSSRSLSPMRISDVMLEHQDDCNSEFNSVAGGEKQSYAAAFLSAISFSSKGRYKKWKLRDFLLFRSASEGRATRAEQLSAASKYAVLSSRGSPAAAEDARDCSSFRSTESLGSSRRAVSAHEMHYTANRAAAEEMKRKTFLPYKQGLLGCLGFNPAAVPDISRGIGSLTRG